MTEHKQTYSEESAKYNDKELLLRIAQGDEQAFGSFFKEYFSLFFHFTNKIVQDRPQAQHIVSQSFQKCWEARNKFSAVSDIRAFMYTICRNASYDYLKARKRQKELLVADHRDLAQNDLSDQGIVHEIIRAELLQEIYNAIKELPPQQQIVINRLFVENKSTVEVAQELGISEESIRSHKRHALNHLRKVGFLQKWSLVFLPFMLH